MAELCAPSPKRTRPETWPSEPEARAEIGAQPPILVMPELASVPKRRQAVVDDVEDPPPGQVKEEGDLMDPKDQDGDLAHGGKRDARPRE